MQVKDIMGRELYSAPSTASVRDVAQIMLRHNIGSVPIVSGDRLVGIITDRDLAVECCTANADLQKTPVADFMTTNPITCRSDLDLSDACDLMAKHQIRRLPVVDGGRLVGIISLGDLAVCLSQDQSVLNALARISVPCRAQFQGQAGQMGTAY